MVRPRPPAAVQLWPGAGGDRTHHTLVTIEQTLAPLPVERCDFPNRRAGKKGPERAPVALEAVHRAAAELVASLGVAPTSIVFGGRSFGGRMCSMAVAAGLPAAGLVLLSYPLHPPGRPDRLRIEHLAELTVPCLFVSGRRDPFGSPAEFDRALALVRAPVSQVWVPGGHDPRGVDDEIAGAVADWIVALSSRQGAARPPG